MRTTLDKLKACQFCIITGLKEIETSSRILQRLLEMGFVEGTGIEVLGFAPLGDPMRISICGCVVAIRKNEANLVEVEILDLI